jgi:hypothetical protein
MTRLFREIRLKSLPLSGGKRYLLYAVGEILLIVIGILFALKISAWSESIKARETERVLLENFQEELKSNYEQLETVIAYEVRAQTAASELLDVYSTDYTRYKSHYLDSLFGEMQWIWTFNPRVSVINSIKSTGQIGVIRNPDIRSFIVSFEEKNNDATEESEIVRSLIVNSYVPSVNKYISMSERSKHIGFPFPLKSKFPSNYAGIFADREAESLISYIHIWRNTEIEEKRQLLGELASCSKLVAAELLK